MTIILYAIPFFFLLIAIELVAERLRKTDYYRVNDAINSLSAGVLSRVTGIMRQIIPFTMYVLIYEHVAVFSLPDTALVWVAAFVIYDFFYYWNHRLGHEVSLLWAAHVVHHSSEEYNLTTALRQTSGSIFSWVFYIPMAVAGFEPLMVIAVGSLNLVYQFWVHTRHVPKLGWYEWIFVTPSNHRVHHAQNQIYLDRNYGGVFILWDRLFGTFQEELDDEKPIYGVRKALHSWDPVWANLQVYNQLIKDSWRTEKWTDKLKVWFGRTGWRPDDVTEKFPLPRVDLAKFQKFDIPLSAMTKLYCLLQHGLTVLIGVMFMLNAANMDASNKLLLAGFVIFSLSSVGLMMERKGVSVALEGIKNLVVLVASYTLALETWLVTSLMAGSAVSLLMLFMCYKDVSLPQAAGRQTESVSSS